MKIIEYFKLFRITHWIKNLFVFVPLLYSKNLLNKDLFLISLSAFIAFSLLSSLVYVINDITDADQDKLHPEKKNRPLAKGTVKKSEAGLLAVILSIAVYIVSSGLNSEFVLILLTYFVINLSYSLKLKNIPIIDLICIASGFTFRIIGGAFVINVDISSWLVLTTLFVSLFLAIMKRRSEIVNVSHFENTRIVLKEYSETYLNTLSTISATSVIVCYALYTVSDKTIKFFNTENLVYTIIFVVYGVFRLIFLILIKNREENIVELILRDTAMMLNIILYFIATFLIIYKF